MKLVSIFASLTVAGMLVCGSRPALADAVYAWGTNDQGQLGDGTTIDRGAPTPSPALSIGVTGVSGGWFNGLAVKSGNAYAWGANDSGQLGDGTTANHSTPAQVTLPGTVAAVAGGGNSYSLALLSNGALYSWGNNVFGQLGDGSTTTRLNPVPVTNLSSGVTAISAGYYHNLALKGGVLYSWGVNNHGQLGDNSFDRSIAAPVNGLPGGITSFSAGGFHSLAVANGAAYAWGGNFYGQLGINSVTDASAPTAVPTLGSGVTSVSAGYTHSLAVRNGAVYAWGSNGNGELGTGDGLQHNTPALVVGVPSTILSVVASTEGSYALSADGSLWLWGFATQALNIGDASPYHLLPPAGSHFTGISPERYGALATLSFGVTSVPEPAAALVLFAGVALLMRRRSRCS